MNQEVKFFIIASIILGVMYFLGITIQAFFGIFFR